MDYATRYGNHKSVHGWSRCLDSGRSWCDVWWITRSYEGNTLFIVVTMHHIHLFTSTNDLTEAKDNNY